ncbi:MAG: YciI family protein [Promicromonosporaceae bacterium]|nr:YciI family protein [Promicromonosporaceae bacterium]
MTTYVVLIKGEAWEHKTPAEMSELFAAHAVFAKKLAERGHTITLTYPLEHSSTARSLRRTPGGVVVTDGPFAESAEQVAGLYVVESDDVDDLVDCARTIADVETGVEVRRTGDPDQQ